MLSLSDSSGAPVVSANAGAHAPATVTALVSAANAYIKFLKISIFSHNKKTYRIKINKTK